uniref:Uncharacterized protein n=1 Tax=Anguilla anguilla TaxID=7936 RepID=A0A0E9UE76_ANGAN
MELYEYMYESDLISESCCYGIM